MVSCEEAQVICNKNQYREASFFEKIQLMVHVLYCKACFKSSKKNKGLTRLIRKANLHSFSEAEKDYIKQRLHKQGES
ncbi:MAG: hypothetical protein EP302_09945 [Bacteroidetes bacterium]|jgi:hypothetical protein|nr:MAG: hypothetical protein EP302_09945 [Bacteroidota bacterium]